MQTDNLYQTVPWLTFKAFTSSLCLFFPQYVLGIRKKPATIHQLTRLCLHLIELVMRGQTIIIEKNCKNMSLGMRKPLWGNPIRSDKLGSTTTKDG